MNIVKQNRKFASACVGIALMFSQSLVVAEEVSAECRGVAAGVVAAMRATGELSTEGQKDVAIMAARRACAAARENLGAAPTASAATASVVDEKPAKQEKMKLWDILSSDQGSKPGNERLKRLRQQ